MRDKALAAMPRVLIVDDIELNRLLLERILQPRGYEILTAEGGREGVDLAQTHSPDLILMDIQMPDVNGYETLKLLRAHERTSNIPAMAVTGAATESDRSKLDSAGFNAVILKPFDMSELLALVSGLTSTSSW